MSQELQKQLVAVARKVDPAIKSLVEEEKEIEVLYKASKHLIDAGGKRLRPFLVLKSCEMVGGKEEDAIQLAAAIELLHTFTLIHDDIIDEDEKRRGVPAVHALWGTPIAITAGDLLFAKVYNSVMRCASSKHIPNRRVLQALSVITGAAVSVCRGQALDMLFANMEEVSEEQYLRMIGRKTAALLKASAQSGAIFGGGTASQIELLGEFAYYCGLAFQIVDDVLGLTADEKVIGKPVGSDVREGKKTIVIVHALNKANRKQRQLILSTLGKREAPLSRMEEVIRAVGSLGSTNYAMSKAKDFIDKAKGRLSSFPASPAKNTLLELSNFLVSRRY
jgi:geranylgeranyl diphosphate synthase type I